MNSKEIVREIGRFYTYDYKTPIHASPPEFEPYLDERLGHSQENLYIMLKFYIL